MKSINISPFRFSPPGALVASILLLLTGIGQANGAGTMITFPSEDALTITADIYAPDGIADRPVVVLFHQAGFSRGEYCDIAPRLNALGFACIAVDQRSGNQANGVTNETAKLARAQRLDTEFEDALPDMRAALAYARSENRARPSSPWAVLIRRR
ncbi:MAG: dienelactone hydrolase [Verrucomicrobiales bacterium]|jgi:dienelactone hydrolase